MSICAPQDCLAVYSLSVGPGISPFSSVSLTCRLATAVVAQNSTYCTSTNNVCYSVNVPEASSGGTGNIFFQITGPSTMSWIGLGQGSQMQGANIFMIFADSTGSNVTLSPRLGTGNHEPQSDLATNVTLLGGSGISDGVMTANIMCEYMCLRMFGIY